MIAIEPIHGLLHRLGSKPARYRAPSLGAGDETGVRQDVEMLHDGGERDRKRARELAHRDVVALIKLRDQGAAGRVGERGEGAVEGSLLILNHIVKYMCWRLRCQPGLNLPKTSREDCQAVEWFLNFHHGITAATPLPRKGGWLG